LHFANERNTNKWLAKTLAKDAVYQLLQNHNRTRFSNIYFIIPIDKVIEIFQILLSGFSFH